MREIYRIASLELRQTYSYPFPKVYENPNIWDGQRDITPCKVHVRRGRCFLGYRIPPLMTKLPVAAWKIMIPRGYVTVVFGGPEKVNGPFNST